LLTFNWHIYVGHEEPCLVSFSEVMNDNIIFVLLLEHRTTDASCVFPDHLSERNWDKNIVLSKTSVRIGNHVARCILSQNFANIKYWSFYFKVVYLYNTKRSFSMNVCVL